MRICFLTHNLDTKNGGGRFSYELVAGLKKQGQEVLVLTRVKPSATPDFEVFDFLKKPWLSFFKIRRIFRACDVIQVIDAWPYGFWAHLFSLGLLKPVLITALGTYSVTPFYSWKKRFLIWVYKKSKAVTAISDYTAVEIRKVLPDLKIKVIYPGFDLYFWSNFDPGEAGEVLRLKPFILSVGAIKPRKGYRDSILAFSIIAKKFDNLNYVIVGASEDLEYLGELREIVRKEGLEKRVFFFTQAIDDNKLLLFYNNAEIFVLTPVRDVDRFEGFGLVYLEAAAAGLPVVATYGSGAESATRDRFNSILVPQGEPQGVARAMVEILSDNIFKNNLKKNSLSWAKNFSWDRALNSYLEVYSNVKHY